MVDRTTTVQDDILRFYMGKKDLDFGQALDLNLASPEEQRELAEDYYDELLTHPFVNTDPDTAAKNARYFGEIDAKAIKNLIAEKLPAFDPTDPEQVSNYASGPLGRRAAFAMNFGQSDRNFRDIKNPSSNVRQAYASGFGTREDYARIHGQVAIYNTLAELAGTVNSPGHTPLQKAVGLHFLQKKYAQLAGKSLNELPADAWIDLRATANGIRQSIQLGKFPVEGAPSERDIERFLKGEIESPFSDEYLKKFDMYIAEIKNNISTQPIDELNRRIRTRGTIDPARIYNLDYISQRDEAQPPLGPDGIDRMSDEQKEKTRLIFEQTLGNYISTTEMQPNMAMIRGESVYDRFMVGEEKTTDFMKRIYGDRYNTMTAAEKELATEAELLRAYADPATPIKYTPLEYDSNGVIKEGAVQTFNRPAPQKVAANPVQPAGAEEVFEANVALAERTARKLNGFLPGMIPTLGADYLPQRMANAHDPDDVQTIKRSFLTETANAADALADAMNEEVNGVTRPEFTEYIRLQGNRVKRGIQHPESRPNLSYTALMDMVDNIHIAEPDAVDERQPGPVFRVLNDHPDGLNAFPLISAAKTAENIMELQAGHAGKIRDAEHPLTAQEDIKIRGDILRETVILDAQLNEMERVSRRRGKNSRTLEAFDDPEAVKKFMKGNPGINTLRAENEGRITAIAQGWPVEDLDLVAGFYAKRDVVKRAAENMPAGSEQRLSYERAGKVLDDICEKITKTQIADAAQRNEVLDYINSYGDALYNDVVAKSGAPEAGQTAELKNAVSTARNRNIPAEAFRTAEENTQIWDQSEELKEIQRQSEEDLRIRRANEAANAAMQRNRREKEAAEERARQINRQNKIRVDQENLVGDNVIAEVDEDAYDENAPVGEQHENEGQIIDNFIDGIFEGAAGRADDIEPKADSFAEFVKSVDLGVMPFEDDAFEDVFATEEEKTVSAFHPTDEYIKMFEEDGSFYGGLYDLQGQREANHDIDGNGKIYGFFEWKDIKERLDVVSREAGADLNIKYYRLPSVTNDCRAFLMGEDGITFDEALAYNKAPLQQRRKAAGRYLDAIEAHPLNDNMSDASKEESARFYGNLHRKAFEKFSESNFPDLEITDPASLKALSAGPNRIKRMESFLIDFTQDIESLHLSSDPHVRTAYIDALGGPVALARIHDRSALFQAINIMYNTAASQPNPQMPLRNIAFAKYLLEQTNAELKEKKLSEVSIGRGTRLLEIATALGSNPLPEANAPSEQQLRDYLDGKAPSPFTRAYIDAANSHMNSHNAMITASTYGGSASDHIKKLENKSDVYRLPYIPAGPHAERVRPDYANMPPELMHDTHVVFDGIYGRLFDAGSNGQVRMSAVRGEDVLKRFKIDGVAVSEIPEVAAVKDSKTPEEFRIIMEAEIMQAMADPKRSVSYTPLSMNASGQIEEQQPVNIGWVMMPEFTSEKFEPDPIALGGPDALKVFKYTNALKRAAHDLTIGKDLRPDDERISPDAFVEFAFDPMFYDESENKEEGEMPFRSLKNYDFIYHDGIIAGYDMIHGLMEDGSLNETGKKNLKTITDLMNSSYDGMQELAAEWDAKNPMLAEMIRVGSDTLLTEEERGAAWSDLNKSITYLNLGSQVGGLHLGLPNPRVPYSADESMKAIQGYPTGEPRYTLPQAIAASRKMTITSVIQKNAQKKGTLSQIQNRLNRRLIISELEETKKRLKEINALYESQFDENGHVDRLRPGTEHVAKIDKYLENDVCHASSYFARGTKHVHPDLDGRHSLITHGWPLADIDLLAYLYVRRDQIRERLELESIKNDSDMTREKTREYEMALKVLDEACDYLDNKVIRNEKDREDALTHIGKYGSLLFNDTVFSLNAARYAAEKQFDDMVKRPVMQTEFMSEAELEEYAKSEEAYRAQKDRSDMKPTMNGPVTEGERAFLDAVNIARLQETRTMMDANNDYHSDPVLGNAKGRVQMFTGYITRFYELGDLLDEDKAEQREQLFNKLLSESSVTENALVDAEDKLTDDGKKTEFTESEKRMLDEIRRAKKTVSEMARRYAAQMDYEIARREEIDKITEPERLRAAAERDFIERNSYDMDTALLYMSEEDQEMITRILADPDDPENLPERLIMTYDAKGNFRPDIKRYPVDTEYAMSFISDEDREELTRLMTAPIPGTEHFDFNVGAVIPAAPRFMPKQIELDYDENGKVRPAAILQAERFRKLQEEEAERDAEEQRLQQIRDERAARRQADNTANYEAVSDLFADEGEAWEKEKADRARAEALRQKEAAERAKSLEEQKKLIDRTERNEEAGRRRALAAERNDPRYEWSFSHILRDAHEKSNAAAEAKKAVQNRDVISQSELASINIEARRASDLVDRMEFAVLGAMEADQLDAQIRKLRPEWYENTWVPGVEKEMKALSHQSNALNPYVARKRILDSLPAEEKYELMGRMANSLPVVLRENLRDKLLTMTPLSTLSYENQVTLPDQDRIRELGDKAHVDAVAPERQAEYEQALKLAEKVLDRVDERVRGAKEAEILDITGAQHAIQNKQIESGLAGQDDAFRFIGSMLLRNEATAVSEGILPAHETAYDSIRNFNFSLSKEYMSSIEHVLRRMEEMGMDPSARAEQTYKYYAFEDVAKAKNDLRLAVLDGDPERIIKAADDYKQKRDEMHELMDYAKQHFANDSAPGNMDNTRNPAVPWEFSQDYFASSQINGIYQIYSALKQNGLTIQEFIDDPGAATRRMFAKLDEERTLKSRMKGKSIGEAVSTLMAESEETIAMNIAKTAPGDQLVFRANEMLTESDPDKEVQASNRMKMALMRQQRTIISRVREQNRNPFTMSDKRGREVLQLMSVVSEADLNENYDRMMCGEYYDADGKKQPVITAEQYITSKAGAEIDYTKLVDRGADIIRSASAAQNSRFNAVTFMQERQKALSMLLTARAADAGKPGFDMLEYELTHTAQMYDMMRHANPQMGLPALTDKQREDFNRVARQYEERRKNIHRDFSRTQKNEISRRRRNTPDIGTEATNRLIRRERDRNLAEEPIRREQNEIRRREEARQIEELNRILAEAALKRREEEQKRREAEATAENEKKLNEIRERDNRIAEHAKLPLVERMVRLKEEYMTRRDALESAQTDIPGLPMDHDLIQTEKNMAHDASQHLFGLYIDMAANIPGNTTEGILPAGMFKEILTAELGEQDANAIISKLPGKNINSVEGLYRLKNDELSRVIGALAARIPENVCEEIMERDKERIPNTELQLTGSLYDERLSAQERGEIRKNYNAQTVQDPYVRAEISELRTQHAKDPASRKEKPWLNDALDYAEQVLRVVKPDVKAGCEDVMHNRDARNNAVNKVIIGEELQKPENRYMKEIQEPVPGRSGMMKPRADKTEDIMRLKNEKYSFDPKYISDVAGMLRKMTQMNILNSQGGGEEQQKVYAFGKIKDARKELRDALKSKDHERIRKAVEDYKSIKKDMDELMHMAHENFNKTEYMDNMDVVRNDDIPWEYARDSVAASQVNAMFLLGNALKDYDISIDEFEKDPSAAIRKMESDCQNKYASINGYMNGKKPGALAAGAASATIERTIFGTAAASLGRHMRAVGGVILADPGTNPEQRKRNYAVHMTTYDFNGMVNNYKQSHGLMTLTRGFRGKSAEGWRAVRALTLVDEKDINYDRMFADPPVSAEGTMMEPFSLEEYIKNKQQFDYAAQANRMENMIKDGCREIERLNKLQKKHPTLSTFADYSPWDFRPYQILKARQEALTELLALRAHEKNLPGYQALERELRELPERYEALRKANPNMNMPALSAEEKDALKQGAKVYNDRAKEMEADEKRLAKEETAKEKTFTSEIKNAIRNVKRREELINKLMEQNAPARQIDAAEEAYNRACMERDRIKQARARAIADDFKAGKLPEEYATARIRQISVMNNAGNQFVAAPPLFGERDADQALERARLQKRESFLAARFLENHGLKIKNENTPLPGNMSKALNEFAVPEASEWEIIESAPRAQNAGVQRVNEQPVNAAPIQQGPAVVPPVNQANMNVLPVNNAQPRRRRSIAEEPAVHNKSFEDLERKFLGDKVQEPQHKRRNSLSGEQNRPQMENIQQGAGAQPENGQHVQGPRAGN
ncbi:MAG: hypothetical protein K6C95_00415 [Lachnospiraceae bacterium]|nr:hypothetical protein [Lachnospiraceae bacterium]